MVSVKPHNKVAVTQFDNPSAVAFLVAHINYSINVGLGINGGQVHGVSLSAVGLRFVGFIIHTEKSGTHVLQKEFSGGDELYVAESPLKSGLINHSPRQSMTI